MELSDVFIRSCDISSNGCCGFCCRRTGVADDADALDDAAVDSDADADADADGNVDVAAAASLCLLCLDEVD